MTHEAPRSVDGRAAGSGDLVATRWTVVLEAAATGTPAGRAAFARLYEDYRRPLLGFVRRQGWSEPDAEDQVQDFFVHLLEGEGLKRLTREGGRFRSFLAVALRNFLANARDRQSAQKRGGGRPPVSLDEVDPTGDSAPPSNGEEAAFLVLDRDWARELVARVGARLEAEQREAGRETVYEVLRSHLHRAPDSRPYPELAERLGMAPGAVKVAVHRLRKRYGELLRAEVSRTVDREDEVQAELRHLSDVLATLGSGDSR